MYALPKVHKEGNKMRPIVSYGSSPFTKISKWLVNEFGKFEKYPNFEIKNSLDLVEKLANETLRDNEIIVSFDIEALFPSIPVDTAISLLKEWLENQNVPKDKISLYIEATKACMRNSFFQFNERVYMQFFGASMGNNLSPFLASLYMSFIETGLKSNPIFPRVWLRYVDDIFAIIKKSQLRTVLKLLNSQAKSIKFTYEIEENGILPFLDLKIERDNNKFKFNIHRKQTSTNRYITSDSNHPTQHKHAAFNSMIFRLINIPLTEEYYDTELNTIRSIATINGYDKHMVDKLIKKFEKRKRLKAMTTLAPISIAPNRRKITFHKNLSSTLKRKFEKFNVKLIECTENKLSRYICNTKDPTPSHKKSGIYSITCKSCNTVYIGQSKREIGIRFKEHINVKRNQDDWTAVTRHIVDNDHKIDSDDLKLLYEVRDERKLDTIESLFIKQSKNILMNSDDGPVSSILFTI